MNMHNDGSTEKIMDISGIANLATNMAQSQTDQAVGIAVLKKALNIETSTAATLLDAVTVPQVNLPSHLGQNINTTA